MPTRSLIAAAMAAMLLATACALIERRPDAREPEPAVIDPAIAALDVLVRLAVTIEPPEYAEPFIYSAGTVMVELAEVDGRYYDPGGMASYMPPQWEWARANSHEPTLRAIIESAESRGLPAGDIFAAFVDNGPPGAFDEPKVFPRVQGGVAPAREEQIAALVTLSSSQRSAAVAAGAQVAARLLGAKDLEALQEAHGVTIGAVTDLRAEIGASAGAEEVLAFLENQICLEWDLWREYPESAPRPDHERGCMVRDQ